MLSVEVEGEGQRLLALYQKAGAAYGGGFRMVETKQHYFINLATFREFFISLLDMGPLNE